MPRRRSGFDEQTAADRLLPTAAALFREKGYSASSTRELAERLGIQNSTLYHYITSKEDLLYEISIRSLEHVTTAVEGAISASPPGAPALRAAIVAHVEMALADRDMHWSMLLELKSLSDARRREVLAKRSSHERIFRTLLSYLQTEGTIRSDIDAKMLTLALLNLLNWSIFWFDPAGPQSPPEIATTLAEIFMNGVTRSGQDLAPRMVGPDAFVDS